jgi:amino acid transporter
MLVDRTDADDANNDLLLRHLGYQPQAPRWMGLFENFGISFAVICIVAGGITAFPAAFCAGGGAAIGIMWPVGSLFALFVAAAMAQLSAAFPTAGGPYHWAAILGGRGWGWACGWINLFGLIFVVAAINIGFYALFRDLLLAQVLGLDIANWVPDGEGSPGWWRQTAFVVIASCLQAVLNHRVPGWTFKLLDIGVVLIIATALGLTMALIAYAGPLDFGRLFEYRNMTGAAGGDVWSSPFSLSPYYILGLGLLHVVYTNTGFDASAHMAEETQRARRTVPRGIFYSVLLSALFGYIMVCAFVLAIPADVIPPGQTTAIDGITYAASKGWNVFNWLIGQSPMPYALKAALIVGIVGANFICGLAALTATSRMIYAFARDDGLPFSAKLKNVDPRFGVPAAAIWSASAIAVLATLYSQFFLVLSSGSAVLLYVSYLMPILLSMVAEITGRWVPRADFTLGRASVLVSMLAVLGGLALIFVGVQPPQDKVLYLLVVLVMGLTVRWQLIQGERVLSGLLAVLTFVAVAYFATNGFTIGPSMAGGVALLSSAVVLALVAMVSGKENYSGPPSLEKLRELSPDHGGAAGRTDV